MFTSRFTKHAFGTVFLGGTLGLVTLLASGIANADTADDQYLAALHQQGIGFGDQQSAINVAHHVCDALGQGMEPSEISQQLVGQNPHIDRQSALLITVDSAQSYCPQYVHTMANGATVVGPDH
jgi:hypothetical protein